MNKNELTNRNNTLTSLEYAGLEALFQRIINAYEDTLGIREPDLTPVSQITRRTDRGIEVADGEYNIYRIGDFAVKTIYKQHDTCIMAGFHIGRQEIEGCFDNYSDTLIDLTPFLDEPYIDIDWLIEQIKETR